MCSSLRPPRLQAEVPVQKMYLNRDQKAAPNLSRYAIKCFASCQKVFLHSATRCFFWPGVRCFSACVAYSACHIKLHNFEGACRSGGDNVGMGQGKGPRPHICSRRHLQCKYVYAEWQTDGARRAIAACLSLIWFTQIGA